MTPTPEQRAALAVLATFGKGEIASGPLARALRREGWIEFHDQVDGIAEVLWSITEEGRKALEEGR